MIKNHHYDRTMNVRFGTPKNPRVAQATAAVAQATFSHSHILIHFDRSDQVT